MQLQYACSLPINSLSAKSVVCANELAKFTSVRVSYIPIKLQD